MTQLANPNHDQLVEIIESVTHTINGILCSYVIYDSWISDSPHTMNNTFEGWLSVTELGIVLSDCFKVMAEKALSDVAVKARLPTPPPRHIVFNACLRAQKEYPEGYKVQLAMNINYIDNEYVGDR